MFIPMPLSIQVALTPMHPTSSHMHSTPLISGSFTGLLSTPDFSSFPPIYATPFISPPGYTPFMKASTPHPTYFLMSSMQTSGLSFPMPSIQPSAPSMLHSSPMNYAHDEQDDTSAHGHGDRSAHDHGDISDPDSANEERRRMHLLRNAPQTIRKHHGKFVIEPEGGLFHDELVRTSLLNKIHLKTNIKRNEEFADDRSRNTQEAYDKKNLPLLYQSILKENGRVYGTGGYTKTIRRRDKSFRVRLAGGEGSSCRSILIADMLETEKISAYRGNTRSSNKKYINGRNEEKTSRDGGRSGEKNNGITSVTCASASRNSSLPSQKIPLGILVILHNGGVASQFNSQQPQPHVQLNYQKVYPQLRVPVMGYDNSSKREALSSVSSDILSSVSHERKRVKLNTNGGEGRRKWKGYGNTAREFTQAIVKFGEACEQVEKSKLQQVMDMEK
ncbi:hypothetical protein KIW84_056268 [Lathyrus oleraceus]|uniref:Uncharacterized protein n=1 Tax=Pisum sativum TaxID=3888 RepID=A0A9D5AKU9_PEA|nr:hypothetical protein KIW84_056268 [Pisum sativum]